MRACERNLDQHMGYMYRNAVMSVFEASAEMKTTQSKKTVSLARKSVERMDVYWSVVN